MASVFARREVVHGGHEVVILALDLSQRRALVVGGVTKSEKRTLVDGAADGKFRLRAVIRIALF
jgi:hypothetical protein